MAVEIQPANATRGWLAASLSEQVPGTHVPSFAVPYGDPGSGFFLGSGTLKFSGSPWNGFTASYPGGFVMPSLTGWVLCYVNIDLILGGPPANVTITPAFTQVDNDWTAASPSFTTPNHGFPLALIATNGVIKKLYDVRPLPTSPQATYTTGTGGVTYQEVIADATLRRDYVSNLDVIQGQLDSPPLYNPGAYSSKYGTSPPFYSAGFNSLATTGQYAGAYGANNYRFDAVGLPSINSVALPQYLNVDWTGLTPPASAPTTSTQTGSLNGSYTYLYTYKDAKRSVMSLASPVSGSVSLTNQAAVVSGAASTDSRVTHIALFRGQYAVPGEDPFLFGYPAGVSNDPNLAYRFVALIPNPGSGTWSYTDNRADSALDTSIRVPSAIEVYSGTPASSGPFPTPATDTRTVLAS